MESQAVEDPQYGLKYVCEKTDGAIIMRWRLVLGKTEDYDACRDSSDSSGCARVDRRNRLDQMSHAASREKRVFRAVDS